LTETGENTNLFSGTLTLITSTSVNGISIHVSEGDFLTVTHNLKATRGIIIPNPTPSKGAILSNEFDVVTASFLGKLDTAIVKPGGKVGGGGGSVGRPGLVLNAVAGASVIAGLFGGSSSGGSDPVITGDSLSAITIKSLDIEGGFGGILSGTACNEDTVNNSVKTGDDISFGFNLYENQGINNIFHVSLYLNAEGESDLLDSETYIRFERFGSGLVVNDPTGIFEHANFEIVEVDAVNFILQYDMSFSKIIGETDFLLVVWDGDRNSSKNLFENAISVESASESDDTSDVIESELVEDSSETLEPTTFEHPLATTNDKKDIPAWIKTTSKWWANNDIGDSDFIKGVQYLVDEEILEIEKTDQNGPTFTKKIPDWVKNSVKWWSEDLIDDSEFKNVLEWLLNEGIMNI